MAAADELFRAHGFDQVTTREIAAAAGVGEATLFRYVPNKNDLLLLVIGRQQDALLDEIEQHDDLVASKAPVSPSGEWYLDRISNIYEKRITFYVNDPINVAKYIATGLQSDNSLRAHPMTSGDRVIDRVHGILASGQEADAIRDDVDALIVARNINGIYIHEALRSPSRNLPFETTWERLAQRFDVMLRPLLKMHRKDQCNPFVDK
ncbi:TetR/AcrR family transcriptional regulator [Gulosibacter molinativorax]|uniref:TetR/AcrR family transcriptional regulator n=1 Tax=Gulosibacter molinativorax TaxID=256821 RepID=UPI00040A0782|nr:TetR/AcrR family transcriptional regulator [Gulosibacter molinativorax]